MTEIGEQEIDLIRRGYEAYNRGDFDAVKELLHPEIVFNRVAEIETPLEGREAVRALMEPDVLSRQENEVHSIEAVGDCALVEATFHGRGAGSGIEMAQRGFHLWRFRDGEAIEFSYFLDRDEALAAARG